MTKDQWLWLGLGVGLVSLLPIWRQGSINNLSLWEFLVTRHENHLSYEEAVSRAQDAYNWGIE